MDSNQIDNLIKKYLDGATSSTEENELRVYFSSSNVAQHLEHYAPLFNYFGQVKLQKFQPELLLPLKNKQNNHAILWRSIAASLVIFIGIGYFFVANSPTDSSYGTYENPEAAFVATQKALALLSENVNVGIESVHYIGEFETAKRKVFFEN